MLPLVNTECEQNLYIRCQGPGPGAPEVTEVPGVRLEDEAVLLGSSGSEVIAAETMEGWVGSINYEIVARISPLLPRTVIR